MRSNNDIGVWLNGYSDEANEAAETIIGMWDDLEANADEISRADQDATSGDDLVQSNIACIVDGAIASLTSRLATVQAANAALLEACKAAHDALGCATATGGQCGEPSGLCNKCQAKELLRHAIAKAEGK